MKNRRTTTEKEVEDEAHIERETREFELEIAGFQAAFELEELHQQHEQLQERYKTLEKEYKDFVEQDGESFQDLQIQTFEKRVDHLLKELSIERMDRDKWKQEWEKERQKKDHLVDQLQQLQHEFHTLNPEEMVEDIELRSIEIEKQNQRIREEYETLQKQYKESLETIERLEQEDGKSKIEIRDLQDTRHTQHLAIEQLVKEKEDQGKYIRNLETDFKNACIDISHLRLHPEQQEPQQQKNSLLSSPSSSTQQQHQLTLESMYRNVLRKTTYIESLERTNEELKMKLKELSIITIPMSPKNAIDDHERISNQELNDSELSPIDSTLLNEKLYQCLYQSKEILRLMTIQMQSKGWTSESILMEQPHQSEEDYHNNNLDHGDFSSWKTKCSLLEDYLINIHQQMTEYCAQTLAPDGCPVQ